MKQLYPKEGLKLFFVDPHFIKEQGKMSKEIIQQFQREQPYLFKELKKPKNKTLLVEDQTYFGGSLGSIRNLFKKISGKKPIVTYMSTLGIGLPPSWWYPKLKHATGVRTVEKSFLAKKIRFRSKKRKAAVRKLREKIHRL